MKKHFIILSFIVYIFLIVLVTVGVMTGKLAFIIGQYNDIKVADQPLGEILIVEYARVSFSRGAYAVVQSYGGQPGNPILGSSDLLLPGVHTAVQIPIEPKAREELLRDGISGDYFYVTLYEKSDKEFLSTPPDPLYGLVPLRDLFGNIVAKKSKTL